MSSLGLPHMCKHMHACAHTCAYSHANMCTHIQKGKEETNPDFSSNGFRKKQKKRRIWEWVGGGAPSQK